MCKVYIAMKHTYFTITWCHSYVYLPCRLPYTVLYVPRIKAAFKHSNKNGVLIKNLREMGEGRRASLIQGVGSKK